MCSRLIAPVLRFSGEGLRDDRRAIVFYHPDVESVAAEFCVRYPFDARLGNVSWGHFPDGWANIQFEHQDNIINRHIIFIMSAHKMDRFLEQICLLVALCRQFARSITVVIPYFGPATMERVVNEGDLATAEPVLKLLSEPLPSTSGGAPALVLVDIHDIRERFYPTDKVTPRMLSAAALILPVVRDTGLIIVFPDEGAWKRFGNLTEGLPVITFVKRRDGDKRELTLGSCYNVDAAAAVGSRFLIWDDLVHSGGTLIECSAALRRQFGNDIAVSAFVTHAIFENDGHERFIDTQKTGISHFYATNTIPEVAEKLSANPDVFTVLDITSVIAPFLIERILPDGPAKPSATSPFVFVSSDSAVKVDAVKDAFGYVSTAHPCASSVSAQPWGKGETRRGLYNRHTSLRAAVLAERRRPDYLCLVSIENGLIPVVDGALEDHAYILLEVLAPGRHHLIERVVKVGRVPEEHVTAFTAEHHNDPDLTFGSYLNKRVPSVDPADWSMSHGGSDRSRRQHITETLEQMVASVLD